jgi:putative iron-dependent peroxidase
VVSAQPGIFALGTTDHCYVELDLVAGKDPAELVSALAALSGRETTISGVNVVIGFRPELWAQLSPDDAPSGVTSFEEIVGDGITMPATQHDAWLWIAGGSRDIVFDSTLEVTRLLADLATVASELDGWLYQHRRDLTGFIDGTENPSMIEAPGVAAVEDGPGAGTSILLYQQWRHETSWEELSVDAQEKVIGRTKPDSIQLTEDVMPADSHVSRNVVEEDGEELAIYRRNVAYGGPQDHGTVFVGFCKTQHPLDIMLRRMAGQGDGIRDALTRHSTPLTGAYYVIPSLAALDKFLPEDEGD